jgi:hypothetical protein
MEMTKRLAPAVLLLAACAHAEAAPEAEPQVAEQPGTFMEGTN